jgi:hypothetical protein
MNEGSYSDTLVKVEIAGARKALRYIMIIVAAVTLLIGLAIFLKNPGLFVIILIIDVLLIWFLPSTKVEFEYVYVDGQIDFDKIIAGNSRKHIDRVDLDDAVVVAPEGSHVLDSHKNLPLKNYSSNRAEDNHFWFVINSGENGNYVVKFTPDERLIEEMKSKSPIKVHTEK